MYSRKRIETIRKMKCHLIKRQLDRQEEENLKLHPTYFCENSDIEPFMGTLGYVAITPLCQTKVYDNGHPNLYNAWSELTWKAVMNAKLFPNAICWCRNESDGKFYAQAYAVRDYSSSQK